MRVLNALILLIPSLAHAAPGDFMAEIFSPPGQAQRTRIRHELRHYGENSLKLQQNKFDLSTPISKGEGSTWRASASADYDAIETSERFPNGRPMPNRLWDIGAGLSHSRELEKGKTIGGSFSVSSPSDRPFGRGRDFGFNLNLTHKIPGENESAWIFFLAMSNTRGFLNYVPLPSAAYAFKAHERLRLVLGLPFVVAFWMPTDLLTVTFTYFPIRNAELRVGVGARRGLSAYALAKFHARNFRLHGRTDSEERLFNEEGLLQSGVNIPLLGPALELETGGGYAFARRYYLPTKAGDRDTAPRVSPGNAAFGFLKLSAAL